MNDLLAFLNDFTIRNVVLGALLLGLTSGVLGSFAVLRQQSLLGDALSHAALPGVALGFLISGSRQLLPILVGALISGAVAALLITLFIKRSRIKTDAALGSVLSIFFALGLVLLTYIGNQNNAGQAGLESFLFGQAASIVPSDILVMSMVSAIAFAVLLLFWKEFKVVTFDPGFASSLGFPVLALELILTILVAFAIVIGLQLVGVVLMAALLIAPAAAARQWVKKLEHMILLAAFFGALSGVTGALISSTARGLATGPLIVIAASLIVFISLLFAPGRGIIWSALTTRKTSQVLQSQQVLADLYKIAESHNQPAYPIEAGMIRSYYGFNASHKLGELEQQGLIIPSQHMQEEGKHWQLTPKGYQEAKDILSNLGKHH